jgi:hypothetical protein
MKRRTRYRTEEIRSSRPMGNLTTAGIKGLPLMVAVLVLFAIPLTSCGDGETGSGSNDEGRPLASANVSSEDTSNRRGPSAPAGEKSANSLPG